MVNYDDFTTAQLLIMAQQEMDKTVSLQKNGYLGYTQLGRVADIFEVLGERYTGVAESIRKGEPIDFK